MTKLDDLLKGLVRSKVDKVRKTAESLRRPPEAHEEWRPPVRSEEKAPSWRCPDCNWEGEFGEAAFRLSDPSLAPYCPACGGELRSRP